MTPKHICFKLNTMTQEVAGQAHHIQQQESTGVRKVTSNKKGDAHGGHGGHAKKGRKKKKKDSALKKFLPLLLIPFIIQTKLIPIFLMKLKMIAIKAFLVGKLAVFLVMFNMARSMLIGRQSVHIDTKYSMDHLAKEHYGYDGSPEYGSWVNS
ncbi:uncharacterized protein LOC111054667 isoform X2 [Nilaparvata lugens]|uniref:uncharacterized protein LOC111054667 isoform X2 n=1 Tax=Nilaparvata lugens TaxID=108931 RepID=UPI00193D44DD|nr:uncharacterized protein LOC111054667 isoform X2 [Nilaparvata lugens]